MAIRVQYAVSPEDLAAVSRSASAGVVKRENIMDSLRRLQQAQQFAAEQQLRREQMAQAGQDNQADRQFRYGLAQLQTGADASQATQEFQNRQALAKASDEAAMERLKASAGLDASNAEHRANLDQRNWGLQHGPKFSPEMGTPQDPNAAVAAGKPPGPGAPPPTPDQSQRARLIQGIQNNEPWAMQEGERVGILQYQKGDKEYAAQLKQQISQIGRDRRMTPQERAALQAELTTELASIRPVMIPPSEQPQTPIEIANSTAMRLNPLTGEFHPINDTRAPENAPIFAPNPKTGKLEKIYDPADVKGTAKDTTPDPIKAEEAYRDRWRKAQTALTKENDKEEMVPPEDTAVDEFLAKEDAAVKRWREKQAAQAEAKTIDPLRRNISDTIQGSGEGPDAIGGPAPQKGAGVNPFGQKAPAQPSHGMVVSEDGTSKPLEPVPGMPGQLGTKESDGSYSIYQTGNDGKTVKTMSVFPKSTTSNATKAVDKFPFQGQYLPIEKHIPLQDGTKMPIVKLKVNGHDVMTTPQGDALTIISKTADGAYRTIAKMMSPDGGTFENPIYAPDEDTWDDLERLVPVGTWIVDKQGQRRKLEPPIQPR